MSCKCQGCGKQYRVDVGVPDEVWECIKPSGKAKGAGLLCGSCIMARLEAMDVYGSYELKNHCAITTDKIEYQPTHKQLVRRIATWLKNQRQSSIVITELVTSAYEVPDIIAWQSGAHSVLVECKVNRADFLSDKAKFFRRQEGYGMGNRRYYAAPTGIIAPEELPDGWGLLEVETHRICTSVEPKLKEANKRCECTMLMSALRRLEISTAVFVRQDAD